MKSLFVILTLAFMSTAFLSQDIYAQTQPDNPDTIENIIRNEFIKAVEAANNNNRSNCRNFFNGTPTAQKEDDAYVFTDENDVLDICMPAFAYYIHDTVQVVNNTIKIYRGETDVTQSIQIITIDTDTSGGIAIDNINPIPKHMSLELIWELQGGSYATRDWKIKFVHRNADRYKKY